MRGNAVKWAPGEGRGREVQLLDDEMRRLFHHDQPVQHTADLGFQEVAEGHHPGAVAPESARPEPLALEASRQTGRTTRHRRPPSAVANIADRPKSSANSSRAGWKACWLSMKTTSMSETSPTPTRPDVHLPADARGSARERVGVGRALDQPDCLRQCASSSAPQAGQIRPREKRMTSRKSSQASSSEGSRSMAGKLMSRLLCRTGRWTWLMISHVGRQPFPEN